ncbi:hypothetical protein SOVF_013340 [Spinacia oleracea]|nr:hypothetical protein SOVF_013340 [Spinacia oleracea]
MLIEGGKLSLGVRSRRKVDPCAGKKTTSKRAARRIVTPVSHTNPVVCGNINGKKREIDASLQESLRSPKMKCALSCAPL